MAETGQNGTFRTEARQEIVKFRDSVTNRYCLKGPMELGCWPLSAPHDGLYS
jgi:hypothetical protein